MTGRYLVAAVIIVTGDEPTPAARVTQMADYTAATIAQAIERPAVAGGVTVYQPASRLAVITAKLTVTGAAADRERRLLGVAIALAAQRAQADNYDVEIRTEVDSTAVADVVPVPAPRRTPLHA